MSAAFDGVHCVLVLVTANFVILHMWSSCLSCSPVSRAAWSGIPVAVSSCCYAKKCLYPCPCLCETRESSAFIFPIFFSINWIFFNNLMCIWLLNPSLYTSLSGTITCFISVNDFKLCFFVITQYLNAGSASAQLPRVLFLPVTYTLSVYSSVMLPISVATC